MASSHPTSTAQQPFSHPQPEPVSYTAPPYPSPNPTPPQAASPPSKRDLRTWWKGFSKGQKAQEAQGNAEFPLNSTTPSSLEEQVAEVMQPSQAIEEVRAPKFAEIMDESRTAYAIAKDKVVRATKSFYNIKKRKATGPSKIFGVPLKQSIVYANVAISLVDEQGRSYIYGYVPIVVAKCGVFLKEKATTTEGIFRLSGSEKRIKELVNIFDSPDRYGKGLDWDGYTVHDAANVLRRYLNQLPEPIVPLDLYERFRDPLRNVPPEHQYAEQEMRQIIWTYQQLITELPPLNRQLLLYILDLLAVFASKADENRMTSGNLAAIFQPGILIHPLHDMSPEDYRLSQSVLVFLIENQDHFLIGMTGTATDEQTVQDIQNGTPPPSTPNAGLQKKTGLHRSSSNASAGAESLRRQGGVRRNVSVNSRHSRQSNGAPSPASPVAMTPLAQSPSTGGVHRSNTVPSKKSPAIGAGRLQKSGVSPHSPSHSSMANSAPEVVGLVANLGPGTRRSVSPSSSGGLQLSAAPASSLPSVEHAASAGQSQDRLLPNPGNAEGQAEPGTPKPEKPFFLKSLTGESDKRAPNKLRKKRIPGSSNPSAQSSTTSLPGQAGDGSPRQPPLVEPGIALEQHHQLESIPSGELFMSPSGPYSSLSAQPALNNTETTPLTPIQQNVHPESHLLPGQPIYSFDGALKAQGSANSLRSREESGNDQSDLDHVDDPVVGSEQKEKRRLWRLSRRKDDQTHLGSNLASPKKALGSNDRAETSTTSFSSGRPRMSLSGIDHPPLPVESANMTTNTDSTNGSAGKELKEDKKGPIDWIKNKMREAKEEKRERDAEKERERERERADNASSEFSRSSEKDEYTGGKSSDLRRNEQVIAEEQAPTTPALGQAL